MDRYRRRINPFEAMAEPARRRIVDILASGEHTAGQLAEVVGGEFAISRTAVSKHLRVLRDAGFLDVRAEYQWRWYYLTREGFDRLESAVGQLRQKMAADWGGTRICATSAIRWAGVPSTASPCGARVRAARPPVVAEDARPVHRRPATPRPGCTGCCRWWDRCRRRNRRPAHSAAPPRIDG